MQREWVVSTKYRAAIGVMTAERTARGLSQRELARRLGKPPSFVNKIELLERRLDVVEFVSIAQAMGVDAQELLGQIISVLREEGTPRE
jgi:transcriptional regulator with XRE-family HTH domain